MTEILLGEFRPKVTIHDALQPLISGPAFGTAGADAISYLVSKYYDEFKDGAGTWMISGSPELFAFPSTLYGQLNVACSQRNQIAAAGLLNALKTVLETDAKKIDSKKVLVDTSPFYAGATHLAWCAVEALIVPVRVDEHSIESLDLTFQLLSEKTRYFQQRNERAGGLPTPRIAAIVMTMVGSRSQIRATPDSASRMYIERALALAEKYSHLFNHSDDPGKAFVLTGDFHSAGRISGYERIPISELKVRGFHTIEGRRRLQVNASVTRYQRQLKYLASMI
ncbi:MAG: ParA family protein [Acetobacteraceae bacterium]|nr:ParA family protein [Acetobacteraceae bacterium]